MEKTVKKSYNKELIPVIKKKRGCNGYLDDLGFFRTPEGSFYDQDDEYFNRHGYDVHGGYYTSDLEYIFGPDWLSDLGCYEDEKEKYMNMNFEEVDDEEEFDDIGGGGDFPYENDVNNNEKIDIDQLTAEMKAYKLGLDNNKNNLDSIEDFKDFEEFEKMQNAKMNNNNSKKKKKKKTKKKKDPEENDWDTFDEADQNNK